MLHIDNHEIDSENSVTVLGIKIDTTPCQSLAAIHCISRNYNITWQIYISKFNYCPLTRNPDFKRTYFEKDPQCARRKEDFFVNRTKTTELHELCLKTLEANIWNSPAEEVKDLTSLPQFTELIKTW